MSLQRHPFADIAALLGLDAPAVSAQDLADLTDEDLLFFKRHGVHPLIAQCRPYRRWTPDDISALELAYEGYHAPGSAQWLIRIASRGAGYVMTHYAPPLPDWPRIWAEIRPDEKVQTHPPRPHFHGDRSKLSALEEVCLQHPNQCARPRAMKPHIDRSAGKEKPKDPGPSEPTFFGPSESTFFQRFPVVGDHCGKNPDTIHVHIDWAKYLFLPSGNVSSSYQHDHSEPRRDPEAGKWLGGFAGSGPPHPELWYPADPSLFWREQRHLKQEKHPSPSLIPLGDAFVVGPLGRHSHPNVGQEPKCQPGARTRRPPPRSGTAQQR